MSPALPIAASPPLPQPASLGCEAPDVRVSTALTELPRAGRTPAAPPPGGDVLRGPGGRA